VIAGGLDTIHAVRRTQRRQQPQRRDGGPSGKARDNQKSQTRYGLEAKKLNAPPARGDGSENTASAHYDVESERTVRTDADNGPAGSRIMS